jgi:hypothetical protein
MKHGQCKRCGQYTWLEKHHIYPQSKFGKGVIIYLCSNCHTDYHQKLGEIKSESRGFYYRFYLSWLWRVIILLIILGLTQIIL